ncbi:MAG: WbqC family protein [Bacteroidales bacterium]|nr:WbqC family protein [Bacteroidales bacterium]
MSKKILLSTAYLAPIQYFTKLLKYDSVIIEAHENFIKQTYRNRCIIYGANGDLSLSIPVSKNKKKVIIKDLMIDYSTNWKKLHLKSIESAYKSSPYFEFYFDEIRPFFEKNYKFLFDFNTLIQEVILEQLEIETQINYSDNYFFSNDLDEIDDFREKILPKKKILDNEFYIHKYNQVFSDKHGFKPNLSIIDLLFNEGPNAINLLRSH